MDASQFIHPSPTEGRLGCLPFWAIKNKAAVNFRVQVFVRT